jgi:hypothetical protein
MVIDIIQEIPNYAWVRRCIRAIINHIIMRRISSLEIDVYIFVRSQDISENIILIDLYFKFTQDGTRST